MSCPAEEGDHVKRLILATACVCALAVPAVGVAGNSGDGSEYGTQPIAGLGTLPRRLVLTREGIRLRVVLDEWKVH